MNREELKRMMALCRSAQKRAHEQGDKETSVEWAVRADAIYRLWKGVM